MLGTNWDWFCGANPDGNKTIFEDHLQDPCVVGLIVAIPQFAFIVVSSIALIVIRRCSSLPKRSSSKSQFLFRLPGHSPRWLLTILLVILTLSLIGEGTLTNDTYRVNSLPIHRHLYITPALILLAIILSITFYTKMERWRCQNMIWLLLAYWIAFLASLVVEMIHIAKRGDARFVITQFDIVLLLVFAVTLLLAVEMLLCFTWYFNWCTDPTQNESDDIDADEDIHKDRMNYLQDYAIFTSTVTFWWLNWIFAVGFKEPITPKHVGSIPNKHTSLHCHEKFKKNFVAEKARADQKGVEISMYRVYWMTYWRRLLGAGLLKMCAEFLLLVGPSCISGIVLYVTNAVHGTDENVIPPHHVTIQEFFSNGFVLVGCIYVANMVRHSLDQTYYYWCAQEGLHVKSALQSMVYEKSLRLSTYALSGGLMTVGQVTYHMSVDAANVQLFFDRGNELWISPVKIVVIVTLLYFQLGVPALIGSSVFLLTLPIMYNIARSISKYTKELMVKSDQRLKRVNELLQGIKVLKLYGWERIFSVFIMQIRDEELGKLMLIFLMIAFNFLVNSGSPIICNLLSFGSYTAITGELLTPDVAFSALAFFNALIDPLFILPFVITLCVNAHVSTKRLSFFMNGPEVEANHSDRGGASAEVNGAHLANKIANGLNKSKKKTSKSFTSSGEIQMANSPLLSSYEHSGVYGSTSVSRHIYIPDSIAIRIENGYYGWDPDSNVPILSDISVNIPAGKLTIIVGSVGSGKSSLLSVMMSEMTTISGYTNIRKGSTVAYGPQKAWLMNATLKENILFGSPLDNTRYKNVINACALAPDLEMLPAGDQTEVGEKGINLSGGQKQRISVARTMYSKNDIVILDDPLSALDMHVGCHLFEQGILRILLKEKRTVVLVTHQLQYLTEAHKIIVMKDGRVALQGDPEEIAAADPSLCADWERARHVMTESEAELSGAESEATMQERESLMRQVSRMSRVNSQGSSRSIGHDSDSAKGQLIVTEDQERGAISLDVYMTYFKAMRYPMALGIVLSIAARAAMQMWTNFWLAEWSESSIESNNTQEAIDQTNYYITIYSVLSLGNIVSRILSIAFIAVGSFLAAKHLHQDMLLNIISLPMRFFDTTPIGRVLNRFSIDTQYIDQRLYQTVRLTCNLTAQVVSSFVVIVTVNIIFLSFMAVIMIVFFLILIYYLRTARELQRNDSVTRSPVFAHFSETLGGLPTIRAFKGEKRFFQSALDRILLNNRMFLYLITAQRWVAIRLDYLGAFAVFCTSLASVLGAFYLGLDVSYVGLAITYALEISIYMNLIMRSMADLELQLNSVERVNHYAQLPTADYSGIEPPTSWPEHGKIEMQSLSVRYAPELDPVLTDVTLTLPKGEKLGICGRTGSGKSSLTLALLRMIDIFKGRILVDGIDISTVPLLTLRQRISIIPQDAFLFTGTIRLNLDPTQTKPDDDLWRALEIAQLKDVIQQLDAGLDYEVTDGGENFSAGQRQLFCLARAFLRNSRIVIMDEATASIDQDTDEMIQGVVAEVFEDRTVLTIAHRVKTIIESDSILTLNEGQLVEFDSPSVLLDRNDSTFASLVRAGK